MPNKIGRFEVLSEITHSDIGAVLKASDPESGQTVALKTVKLELLGEQAAALVQRVLEEAESSKVLNSHNVAALYGAGEIEGQLVACLEYVQGNSIGTMLSRKEGFSIWDIQDIARQTCQGLDHAHVHKAMHYSLEPAKVMVQWDGTVKILGFGTSVIGAYASQASGAAPDALHYMSPEQLRGDPVDARSNLFSLGAILFEMVTERKAFQGDDADQVRQSILEMTPVAPDQINRKIHPVLSQVIMKALSKAPEERYQSGQELVNDLERCKESATKAAAAKKPAQPLQGLMAPQKLTATPAASTPQPAKTAAAAGAPVKTTAAKAKETAPAASTPAPAAKAAAAAAAWPGAGSAGGGQRTPKLDPSAQFISNCVKASVEALTQEETTMSAASPAQAEVEAPRIAVDPMMDESKAAGSGRRSFSEIDELPPLKEVYIAPPSPPPASLPEPLPDPPATLFLAKEPPEKPKLQPREVAKKAVKEIKKTPPKLFMYSIAGAVGIILMVVVGIAFHIRSENADDDSAPVQSAASASTLPPQPDTATPQASGQTAAPAQRPVQVAPEVVTTEAAPISVKSKYGKRKDKTPAPAPAIIPGQLTINSTPEGAQVRVDGRMDASWVTPFNLTGLTPGQHTVSVSKPGYGGENRNIDVASGSKSFLVVQLAQVGASVSVASDPTGAAVIMDGKDTGRVTPTQISVDKPGNHTFVIRKQGYLDETTSANLQVGQTLHLSPALRALGNTAEIKTVGKFKKMFGGGDTAGMGSVSIKTQPKGAQVAVNNRILDKTSPLEFYLNPGNYVIDVTLSGFKPIHRVVNVDRGNKVAMDEILQRE